MHACLRTAPPTPPPAPQYMHIPDSERCNWLRARIETAERQEYNQEEKLRILDRWAGRVGGWWWWWCCVGVGVGG